MQILQNIVTTHRPRVPQKNRSAAIMRNLWEYLVIAFAGILYSVALKYFIFPARVILTGTEGIATAVAYFFDKQWVFISLYAVFQTCLLIFAFFKISRRFALRTMLVVGIVIGMLSVLPEYKFANPEPENERIILVIFGGILVGIAKAIAFGHRASTGDEDIPGAYFSIKYLKPVGSIAIIAAVLSTSCGMILDYIRTQQLEVVVNTLMYTSIYIFMCSETLNNFYKKFKLTLLNVITDCPQRIGAAIKRNFPYRTYTIQEGEGGHSKERVQILRTILTHEELPSMVRVIEDADTKAFYYYNDIEGISKHYYITPIG